MRIGAIFPQTEIGSDPSAVRDWAQAVEELGYRHILAYDHVLGASTANRPGWVGYTSDSLFHEVMVLFGYLAAITHEIELVTGVLVLPQRQTALVAKQAAEIDVLSGGRLRLGIGVGWNPVEYEALNQDFHTRGVRSEEQIAVLRALWCDPVITFQGRWHQINEAGLNPLPVQRPIPIWIGAGRRGGPVPEVALKRIGRIGDGWFPQRAPDQEARALVERLRAYTQEAGRAPDAAGIEARLSIGEVAESEWAAYAEAWRNLGATHLGINTMGAGLAAPRDHIEALRRVKAALGV